MKCEIDEFAVITGSSRGLGRALAEECAARGMNLILAALPETGLPEVASILERSYSVRAECVETNLTESDSPERLSKWICEKGFTVAMLMNNAGVGYHSRFADSTIGQNETTIQLNILALLRLTHLLLPGLKRRQRAYILNVASLAAYFPIPTMPVYSPSKSFVLNFSLALREELRGSPVSVSVLCPNGIRTNRECRQLIDRQGLAGRITCLYPDEVARAALGGLLKRQAIIIPGLANKALRLASAFVPRALSMRVISRRWGTQTQSHPMRPVVMTTGAKA